MEKIGEAPGKRKPKKTRKTKRTRPKEIPGSCLNFFELKNMWRVSQLLIIPRLRFKPFIINISITYFYHCNLLSKDLSISLSTKNLEQNFPHPVEEFSESKNKPMGG